MFYAICTKKIYYMTLRSLPFYYYDLLFLKAKAALSAKKKCFVKKDFFSLALFEKWFSSLFFPWEHRSHFFIEVRSLKIVEKMGILPFFKLLIISILYPHFTPKFLEVANVKMLQLPDLRQFISQIYDLEVNIKSYKASYKCIYIGNSFAVILLQ